MVNKHQLSAAAVVLITAFVFCGESGKLSQVEIAELQPKRKTRLDQAGWAYDRYQGRMETLDANKRMLVADLKGPGIIRQIYGCRKTRAAGEIVEGGRKALDWKTSRGIVLEIYYEDAEEPAVMCPVADFYLMGCNDMGQQERECFASKYIVNNKENYQCYFPMPFRQRVRIYLRNDTPHNLKSYPFVEWEKVPELPENLGYFHATYSRKCFQLNADSDLTIFEVHGAGHLVGRQFSYVTDEPEYRNLRGVMDGNYEIDIDGQERTIDYLGTECAFNFGWGWRRFTGPLSGAVYHQQFQWPGYDYLWITSTYRFYDHMPIRFEKSLRESIDWSTETFGFPDLFTECVAKGGSWVDLAAVHYWYQNDPAGFKHEPMRPLDERMKPMLQHNTL